MRNLEKQVVLPPMIDKNVIIPIITSIASLVANGGLDLSRPFQARAS